MCVYSYIKVLYISYDDEIDKHLKLNVSFNYGTLYYTMCSTASVFV